MERVGRVGWIILRIIDPTRKPPESGSRTRYSQENSLTCSLTAAATECTTTASAVPSLVVIIIILPDHEQHGSSNLQ